MVTKNRSIIRLVRDARGRRVPAVSIRELARSDSNSDDRRRKVVRDLKQQTKDMAWKIAGANAIWILTVAFIWSRTEESVIGRKAAQSSLGGALALLALVGVVIVVWYSARRAMAVRRAKAAARAGFCGSCGYDLHALPHADDAHVVCPECGSAWRIK